MPWKSGVIFFTDENISHYLAQMLEIFDRENEIRAHKDHFEPGTPDHTWLQSLVKWEPKPVVLCGDGRILRNPVQRRVLHNCDLHFIYLGHGWMQADFNTQAWKLVKVWPDVKKNVMRVRNSSIFEVSLRTEKIELKGSISDLR